MCRIVDSPEEWRATCCKIVFMALACDSRHGFCRCKQLLYTLPRTGVSICGARYQLGSRDVISVNYVPRPSRRRSYKGVVKFTYSITQFTPVYVIVKAGVSAQGFGDQLTVVTLWGCECGFDSRSQRCFVISLGKLLTASRLRQQVATQCKSREDNHGLWERCDLPSVAGCSAHCRLKTRKLSARKSISNADLGFTYLRQGSKRGETEIICCIAGLH